MKARTHALKFAHTLKSFMNSVINVINVIDHKKPILLNLIIIDILNFMINNPLMIIL